MRSKIYEKSRGGRNIPPRTLHNRALRIITEVDRLGRHHYPNRTRWADHRLAFSAWTMAAIVFASAPRPARIVTPSTSTSIIPTSALGLASRRFARGRRCAHIHPRRHKLQFFRFRMPGRSFSQLTAPANTRPIIAMQK